MQSVIPKSVRMAALLAVLLPITPATADQSAPEIIRFGGDAVYPPFEWSEQGQPTGFNVDLARTIAEVGAARAQFRLGDWPEVVRALAQGDVDAVAMFQSEEREQQFWFTAPFYYVNHAVYGRSEEDGVSAVTDLAGRSVALERLSYAHQQLQQQPFPVEFVLVANTLEALQAVAAQRADYALLAAPTADHLLELHNLKLRRTGPPLWPRPYAFAVRKDRPEIAAWLSQALNLTLATGRYDQVYARWQDQLDAPTARRQRLIRHMLLALAAVFLLAVTACGWSWSLRRTVAARTGRLREELARRETAEAELRQLADYDQDSGLPNAQCFTRLADAALAAATRQGRSDKQMAVIQLAELKRVIATFGYAAGQRFVREFADRLRRLEFDVCGHMGRGVFAVLASRRAMQTNYQALSSPLAAGELGFSPHTLIGTATWPTDGETAVELIRRAETALAHGLARHQSHVAYHPVMEPDQLDLQIVRDFRRSRGDGLSALFQPQLDLRTGQITGAEALVRWHHPELGPLSPAKFIPLLEDAGLIALVTERMIDTAVRLAARLRRAGRPCTISINVAASDLLGSQVPDTVGAVLAWHEGLAGDLKLELTETSIADQPEVVRQTLTQLRQMGVLASVDDFGTGYASLSYLSVFPIQEVKIDRLFVGDMLVNPRNRSIVRSTIAMAHELGLVVVAEGAEDQQTLEALREDGCDRVQGFVIARPLDESALFDRLSPAGR